jgi:L-alanine-DL-glutamate epimerase-like enolase superfamily enzyme
VDELDIARIRAYAVTPAKMPATRFSGREEPTTMNIEIVRLTLANGAEGFASEDSGWGGTAGGDIVHDIRDLSSQMLGQCVRNRTSLTESLLANTGSGPWKAVSLIDCAMWDAFARSSNKPLWQLLGGYQARISAYASTPAKLHIKEYLDDAQRYAGRGYRAIKFHMNGDPVFDLEMVQAVADAHRNSTLRFMIDLEQSYTFDEALKLGNALDKLPFDWMEAPLPDSDIDAYVDLNNAVAIDILPAGNTLLGPERWSEGLRRRAWSRLRCDVTNAGGITTVLKAIKLAQTMNVPVELQSFGFRPAQHANLQVMLGVKGCTWFEHPVPHEPYDYATRSPLTLDNDGCVHGGHRSGLGIDMDWEQIATDAFESFDSMA